MCDVKHCKQRDLHIIYYDKSICMKCWLSHCENNINLKELFEVN